MGCCDIIHFGIGCCESSYYSRIKPLKTEDVEDFLKLPKQVKKINKQLKKQLIKKL